jgi:MFS family permease
MPAPSNSIEPRAQVPKDVRALGFVRLGMDTSSEMIHSVLPVFLVTALGASAATLGLIEGIWTVLLGVMLWGLHLGMSQGLLSALVASSAAPGDRGAAFGVSNFFIGAALLVASIIAGLLWDTIGPAAIFLAGAGFTAAGLILVLLVDDHHVAS